MRTLQEIATEIEALKGLEPTGKFAAKTARRIARAIDELEGRGFDTTSKEFEELPDDERVMIQEAKYWREGILDYKPSEGWDGLVAS